MQAKRPTTAQYDAWWASLPDGTYTCSDCGHQDSKAYVQPKHPYYVNGQTGIALCVHCVNRRNAEYAEQRKAQRAAAPRCEVCNRRGTWHVAGVRLCGTHKDSAVRNHANAAPGVWGMILEYDRDDVLRWATS